MGLSPQKEEGRNSGKDCAKGKGRKDTKRLVKGKKKKVNNPVLDLFVRGDVILCLGMLSPKCGCHHHCAFWSIFTGFSYHLKTSAPTLPMKCPP